MPDQRLKPEVWHIGVSGKGRITNVASLIGLAMMAGGLIALGLRHQALSPSPPVILLQALAVALMAWARATFGWRSFRAMASPTDGGLVTTGPYRWLRHPIYAAVCLFGWACWFGYPSWFSAGMAGLITTGGVTRTLIEEALLRVRYPGYVEYARKTWRMIPHVF